VLEVKSIDRLLGTPVSYAYAVKAGPWIFLTGHEAYDWETGIPDEVALIPASSRKAACRRGYRAPRTRSLPRPREGPRIRIHLSPAVSLVRT
jgi:hypothetical protein